MTSVLYGPADDYFSPASLKYLHSLAVEIPVLVKASCFKTILHKLENVM